MIKSIALWTLRLAALAVALYYAYDSRMHAVNTFGRVIHEFDPYFNLRATEYLVANGWEKFINWFDERSWYPLGRPVGTTIYPGLQFTAWFIYEVLNKYFNIKMSVNDVCVFIPAWFSILSCLFVFGMAYEASGSGNAGVVAAFIMAIVPSHIMRSVAGGYDNESIAMAAMCGTFYLWMLSIRNKKMWPIGILTAICYIYMVAAWGGYVFVLNMVGVHAMALVLLGCYSDSIHHAYSLFYVIGTLGAIQWPVVGLAPIKSLEQLGPMFVFFVYQILYMMSLRRQYYPNESIRQYRVFQVTLLSAFAAALAVVVAILAPRGYFGPLSARIRGLFIRHTHTGNPLVDSVAEHQATQDGMYYQFFHNLCYIAPIGFLSLFWTRSYAKSFLIFYALVSLYFSRKMNRLVLLLSPVASILGGLAITGIYEWSLYQFNELLDRVMGVPKKKKKVDTTTKSDTTATSAETNASAAPTVTATPSKTTTNGSDTAAKDEQSTKKKDKKKKNAATTATSSSSTAPSSTKETKKSSSSSSSSSASPNGMTFEGIYTFIVDKVSAVYDLLYPLRVALAIGLIYYVTRETHKFWDHSRNMAQLLSNPSIILQGQTQDGRMVKLDDFREAYWWIRDNTPEDARIMSWWDYGYQISQIANRTTLADGNTWNHEHIALLGKILVSNVEESHKIARHLCDYVLVWSTRFVGNAGDDIAKSPHMARIGGSVFKDVKAEEFYVDRQGHPSQMMRDSLVYNLVLNGYDRNVPAINPNFYKEVYTSTNRMVRIYKVMRVSKDSKRYCAENRGYQAWLSGKPLLEAYPPGLNNVLSKRQDFQQLEDFNKKAAAAEASSSRRIISESSSSSSSGGKNEGSNGGSEAPKKKKKKKTKKQKTTAASTE